MLEFFRKYQRYFFLIVTVVIIISFSFFGTYNSMGNMNYHEQVAFTAVDGTAVKRSELDQMTLFLGTDADDKILFGGLWGPNFLNDGVLAKDFVQSGLAAELALQYAGEITPDLDARLEKEKRFKSYVHPQAQFLSVENAWKYFAPNNRDVLEVLRNSPSAISSEALNARIQLYLAQKKFPAGAVRQVLMYQQNQASWITPDPNLPHADFSLFGYHTLSDWFGPRLIRLMSAFIINGAKVAEQKGYRVTKQEALADLKRNAEQSFVQNSNNSHVGVANSTEYFNEQLSRMSMDSNTAAALWQKVLLFRRMFQDAGSSVFVDPITFQTLNSFSKETVEGEIYRLPEALRFNSYADMLKFETYLASISARPEGEKELLSLPTKFYATAEIAKSTPSLVQKRYLLDVASIEKNTLQAKVSIKETWNWEVDHWDKIQKKFPELSLKDVANRDERFKALDGLDEKKRSEVDAYARAEVVNTHPEWLTQALQDAPLKHMTLGLALKGGQVPFEGVSDREALMKVLDGAKLNAQDNALAAYTADQSHFYKIVVVDRSPELEVVTFAEAQAGHLLDNVTAVPENEKLLNAIKTDYAASIAPVKAPDTFIKEISASLRLNNYVRTVLDKIKKDPKAETAYIHSAPAVESGSTDKLTVRVSLADQWKLQKAPFSAERNAPNKELNLATAFAMQPGSWSAVQTPVSGDIHFFVLNKRGTDADGVALAQEVQAARTLLGDAAEQALLKELLRTPIALKDKGDSEA